MNMHACPVIHEDRLGHESYGLAVATGHVLGDILVLHQVVRHPGERVEAEVDLSLSGGANLMMMHFNAHADALERQHHIRADILQTVHRRHREIALLISRLIAQILLAVFALLAAVPEPFFRVEVIEADAVENVKFSLWTEISAFAQAAGFQISFGLFRHSAWIAGIQRVVDRITHITNDAERRDLSEWIDKDRFRVRNQKHVAFINHLKAPNARAIKADAFRERTFIKFSGRDGKVLPQTGEVNKLQINDLDTLLFDELHYFFGCHGTMCPP